jgi:hypothetical protein
MRGKRVDLLIVGGLWRWSWLLLLLVLMKIFLFRFGRSVSALPCLQRRLSARRQRHHGPLILTRQTRDSAHASFQTAVSVSPALHTGIPLFSVLHSILSYSHLLSTLLYRILQLFRGLPENLLWPFLLIIAPCSLCLRKPLPATQRCPVMTRGGM